MARPTAEERRQDYLAIGAEMVLEFDRSRGATVPVDALANIRLADVARRAGVTKGALYHIWESQEEFRHDLMIHLLELEAQVGIRETATLIEEVPRDEDPGRSMRRLNDFAFRRLRDDPAFLARFSFYTYAANPEVRELLLHGRDRFRAYYEMYLRRAGRRLREPFTLDQVIVLAEAYLYGSILRHRTSPELVDRTVRVDEEDWGLVQLGMRAILDGLSEPVEDDDQPRS